jgi:hypothetical protein
MPALPKSPCRWGLFPVGSQTLTPTDGESGPMRRADRSNDVQAEDAITNGPQAVGDRVLAGVVRSETVKRFWGSTRPRAAAKKANLLSIRNFIRQFCCFWAEVIDAWRSGSGTLTAVFRSAMDVSSAVADRVNVEDHAGQGCWVAQPGVRCPDRNWTVTTRRTSGLKAAGDLVLQGWGTIGGLQEPLARVGFSRLMAKTAINISDE